MNENFVPKVYCIKATWRGMQSWEAFIVVAEGLQDAIDCVLKTNSRYGRDMQDAEMEVKPIDLTKTNSVSIAVGGW